MRIIRKKTEIMKKLILIAIASLAFASCGNKEQVKETIIVSKVVEAPARSLEFSNPAYIAGSNFGEFFISMLKTQNYDMALKFTSKASIEKFGVEKIKEKYANFKFNFKLKLASKSADGNILKFTTNEFATGKFKTMTIAIENDSCKLVLPDDLNEFLK